MTTTDTSVPMRPPRAADRARAADIVLATGVFRPDEVAVALEVFDAAVACPGADYHAVGAYDGQRLVGFAIYGHTPCTLATWDLYWIAVDPAAHRHGIGRQLMAATESAIAARGGHLIVVETSSRADYSATRAFYQSLGYGQTARVPGYYAPGDHLIVYTKHLGPPDTETVPHV